MRRCIVLLFLALAACGGDSTAPGSIPGVWHLRSINGVLPYSTTQNGTLFTVTASTLTISTNGTYTEIISYTATQGGTTLSGQTTQLGLWFGSNGTVTFNDQTDNLNFSGSITGNTLTEINSGITEVYVR